MDDAIRCGGPDRCGMLGVNMVLCIDALYLPCVCLLSNISSMSTLRRFFPL